ncbi:hypothetical protein PV392_04105 [Streptomyces sp. ME03-5709C]|nr:hypothetical protein [Streptomyces sp. ME03-5709C]
MNDPVHQTILLCDIEGSGLRDDVEKPVVRRVMYETVHAALAAAGAERTQYRSEDRGDGVMLLVDPSVPRPRLLHAVLHHLPEDLAGRNRLAAPGVRARLRVVLHGGEVGQDPDGVHGSDLDAAFRMLDSEPLRAALRESAAPVAVAVSEFVHSATVRHGYPGISPSAFHHEEFTSKEGPVGIWVHAPHRSASAAVAEPASARQPAPSQQSAPSQQPLQAQPPEAAPPRAPAPEGPVVFNAGTVHGDQFTGGKHIYHDGRR